MALGDYPVVTLNDARDLHYGARETLAAGVDPMAERKAEAGAKQKEIEARLRKEERSFENVARAWWANRLNIRSIPAQAGFGFKTKLLPETMPHLRNLCQILGWRWKENKNRKLGDRDPRGRNICSPY